MFFLVDFEFSEYSEYSEYSDYSDYSDINVLSFSIQRVVFEVSTCCVEGVKILLVRLSDVSD